MWLQGRDPLLGLVNRCRWLSCTSKLSRRPNYFHLDAHDIEHSSFFDPSDSGVGGWGDPENDYQINTGGFKDQIRVYPSPHHIRRNFSLFPFTNPDVKPPFGNDPNAPPAPVGLMVNTTMTKENVDSMVANFTGDYFGFQSYFESPAVSPTLLVTPTGPDSCPR